MDQILMETKLSTIKLDASIDGNWLYCGYLTVIIHIRLLKLSQFIYIDLVEWQWMMQNRVFIAKNGS